EAFVLASGDRLAVRSLVFGRGLHAATSGRRLVIGTDDEPNFEILDREGDRLRIVRWADPPRPVEAGAFERFRDEELDEDAPPPLLDMWREMFDAMPRHQTYPAFASLRTDTEGRIWVADYRAPGEEARWWSVFDADGLALGRVRTPDGLRVLEIGSDYLLGVIRDELDVERVRLHGIEIEESALEVAGDS
ncbi:MAG: hypothetical protein R3266_06915, partial [Gemmatimonadota bacterium]|nr:hypothetical protein [Gemmatimonadota bacterium]